MEWYACLNYDTRFELWYELSLLSINGLNYLCKWFSNGRMGLMNGMEELV